MVLTFQNECIQIIVPVLVQAHNNFQESHVPGVKIKINSILVLMKISDAKFSLTHNASICLANIEDICAS